MSDANHHYCSERSCEERKRRRANPQIAAIHSEMADRYAELASVKPPQLQIVNCWGRKVRG